MLNINEKQQSIIELVSRLLLAAIFLISGLNKISNYQGTSQYMEAMDVPSFLLPLVIATEVVGALMIILGYKTRLVAFLLAGLCLSSAVLFHFQLADQNQFIHFFKNLAIAGGFIAVMINGAGRISIDNKQQS
ncbi:DoxX family protein [Catenovulum maritimum]|uniref:DoxX family protein n=1 Tax=Catenovulum maritimum TaxID=1513271 RepID=A0A0J8GUV9_9ALTE|nr:DoxX family protein [Catenovulum maritimum]KMT66560.1 hypothetical protein XM47_03225 [Catenovulum maritimum]